MTIEDTSSQKENVLLEQLADEAHQIWCGWMMYMFKQGGFINAFNEWVMLPEPRERWHRQMKTPYAQLSEKEKESDREIARRYLEIMEGNDGH